MTVLAIDPGETTGWAIFTEEGKAIHVGDEPSERFIDRLAAYNGSRINGVVVEDYRLRQGKQMQQTGSKFETVQVIGASRLFARLLKVEFLTQSPQVLRITAQHMHMQVPAGHIADRTSALLHGYRYFLTERGIDTAVLRERNGIGIPTL